MPVVGIRGDVVLLTLGDELRLLVARVGIQDGEWSAPTRPQVNEDKEGQQYGLTKLNQRDECTHVVNVHFSIIGSSDPNALTCMFSYGSRGENRTGSARGSRNLR